MFWPRLKRKGTARLAAEYLGKLRHKGLLARRIEPRTFYLGGPENKPTGRYYQTDFGFAVHEYWERQRTG